jgi:hypothetical protein
LFVCLRRTAQTVFWLSFCCNTLCYYRLLLRLAGAFCDRRFVMHFPGMVDASTDPDYCKAYDELSRGSHNGGSSTDVDAVAEAERRYFMSRVDDIVLRLIFHQV